MSKKYIDIKRESCNRTHDLREAFAEIASHNVIFVLSYPDTQYPSYSAMSMGQFCEVAYSQGDKIIWQTFNTETSSPIDDYITQLGNKVSPIVKRGAFTAYIGKSREEFHTEKHDLVYQNKYRFKGDGLGQFDAIFEEAEGQHSKITDKADQEIIFRVSFGVMDDPYEFIVTKDCKYGFVSSEKLEDDKTDYEVIYPDNRYHLVKVNQKYYKQALEAKKSILEKGKKDWPTYDFGKVAGRQPELYRKTLWLLSHDTLDGWEDAFTPLDIELTACITQYRNYCDLLYGDDHVSEYKDHESEAKELIGEMKMLIADDCSGEVSAEEFEQIFNQERKQVLLVSLPREGRNMVMYIDMAGYVRRVECVGEQKKLAEKIAGKLAKDKKFERHENYFDRANGDEIVNVFFRYAYELDTGKTYSQDRDLAYKIYQYIAERWDEADAYYNLGLFYQEGYGSLEKDIKTAIKYYELAIEKGDKRYAANNLGNIYATGDGVPKDAKKALKYYEIASDHGDFYAIASLAKMYEKGEGVERNRLYAWELYKEAEKFKWGDGMSWEFREKLEKDIERLEKKLK